MIYTIGHEKNYLKGIADSPDGKINKIGKREPCEGFPQGYVGGYAFASVEDARRRINEAYPECGFAVFGLQTTWDNTVSSADGWWHNLIEDSEIIVLS